MNPFKTAAFALIFSVVATGCTSLAPQYSASPQNIQTLKDGGNYSANVGVFASNADKENVNPIPIRAALMKSPYDDSYANYLAEAIRNELSLANRLNKDSRTEVSGILLKNHVNANGISVGVTELKARFVVKQNGQSRYDQVKEVRHEFPSSFAGAIAISSAMQEYPFAVQKLLAALFADRDFVAALK